MWFVIAIICAEKSKKSKWKWKWACRILQPNTIAFDERQFDHLNCLTDRMIEIKYIFHFISPVFVETYYETMISDFFAFIERKKMQVFVCWDGLVCPQENSSRSGRYKKLHTQSRPIFSSCDSFMFFKHVFLLVLLIFGCFYSFFSIVFCENFPGTKLCSCYFFVAFPTLTGQNAKVAGSAHWSRGGWRPENTKLITMKL